MNVPRAIFVAVSMGILIVDSRFAAQAVAEGITLCLQTVIPSLFPFFVLTSMLASLPLSFPKILLRLFRVSPAGGSALLAGLLGGYPVGAKTVSECYANGSLSKAEAQRLLPICNQCGPSFLFGITAVVLGDYRICFLLWLIQLLSMMILANIIPGGPTRSSTFTQVRPISWTDALQRGIRAMASVCGWIILFRVVIGFVQRWFLWRLPLPVQITLSGLLELTNGCTALDQINDPSLRFLICGGITGFGGLCVTMQSFSVMHPELDKVNYFPGKILQVGLMLLSISLLQQKLYPVTYLAVVMVAGATLFFRKSKKTVAFPEKTLYNEPIKDARKRLCSLEKR